MTPPARPRLIGEDSGSDAAADAAARCAGPDHSPAE
jgi:hypothetical protein